MPDHDRDFRPLFLGQRQELRREVAHSVAVGRNDAGHALRSGSEHAAFEEMVLAQGLGDADRQAPRDKKSDRGSGTPVGCDHAPHMG